MGIGADKVREILKVSQEPVSLETPIGEEEDSHLGDFIEDSDAVVPVDAASFILLQEQLEGVLETLSEREKKVVQLRFGLVDGHPRTLEEVGREFGVTRERIRRIESKTLSKLRHKDLLGISDLTPDEILLVLDTTEAMREIGERPIKKVPALRGKTVVNLFFEASTRTRTSFEIAEKRLSADTLNIAAGTSSVVKGETLVDTALNLEAMSPDLIVVRHSHSGACHLLSRICKAGIINAGDGMHEHPTQALLDAFTIRERKKKIAGLKIAIVGDLLHSRVLRSNVQLLSKLGAEVWVSGPPTLMPPGISRDGVRTTHSVDEAVEGADVVMLLRVQLERMQGAYFPSLREYFTVFGMTRDRLRRAKEDVIIMHPGPMNRGVEIDSEVADGPYSVILEQVANGVAVRMAVLYLLAGGAEDETAA